MRKMWLIMRFLHLGALNRISELLNLHILMGTLDCKFFPRDLLQRLIEGSISSSSTIRKRGENLNSR